MYVHNIMLREGEVEFQVTPPLTPTFTQTFVAFYTSQAGYIQLGLIFSIQ